MMNIYGHFFSMPSNKVRLCASYLGLPHEYHHVDLQSGAQMEPDFIGINPMGRVPAIEDDGFTLSQSNAICKYLCDLSGPSSFYPEDAQEQAVVNQWVSFASQHVQQAMSRLFFNKIVAPMLGEAADENSVKTGENMLARDLPHLEAKLVDNDYILGEKITLADIAMICALEPAEMVGLDLDPYSGIQKWRETIMNREFYKRVHAHFGAEMNAK
ncbi:MAG: glutathione S-transferase family protein [Acidimicrobiales bacterium]|nr:glutathione S-transferase family protein [Hyphomonadaceae bacterium]RZV40889.1 MAG: glutathione S-transferase family protein [Acidimicrobiales bacterium]